MPWELSARPLAGMLALGLGEGRCRHQEECVRSVSITLENYFESPYTAEAAQGRVYRMWTSAVREREQDAGLEVEAVSGWLFLKEGYN